CKQVLASLEPRLIPRVHILEGEYDQSELKHIIGNCNFFIGSRMHSCIAALSQGIPAVGVAYSRKFAGVFESVCMNDWVVDLRTITTEEAVARTIALLLTRGEARATLARKLPQV